MTRYRALLAFALLCSPMLAAAQAVISNGTVRLGVRADGALMPSLSPYTGITFLPTGADGLTAGCACEAWGIANATASTSGHTGGSVGTSGITNVSFASTATTATSVTNAFNTFEVTHAFTPSAVTPNIYDVKVTIRNTSAASARVLYGRAMDWDIPPTTFSELVTLQRGNSTRLIFSSDNGFFNANPLDSDSGILFTNQNVIRSGPDDHGAHFRFDFGVLAPGATLEFTIGYGAAANAAAAITALSKFGAESYSLGEPSNTSDGSPNTFIFGFKGIGGTPIVGGKCADQNYGSQPFGREKLIMCQQICENPKTTPAQRKSWLTKWYNVYHWTDDPPCAI